MDKKENCGMMKNDKMHKMGNHKGGLISMFTELNLTSEQQTKIEGEANEKQQSV